MRNGDISLQTHQVTSSGGARTRIVDGGVMSPGGAGSSVTIPLDNAAGALSKQTQLLNKGSLGQYDKASNSCVSHVCDVLQAGGVNTPIASGSTQLRFLINIQKGAN